MPYNSAIKSYIVNYSLRGNPRATGQCTINAPSMQYIRDNWYAISGGRPYIIRSIKAIGR